MGGNWIQAAAEDVIIHHTQYQNIYELLVQLLTIFKTHKKEHEFYHIIK